MIALLDNTVMSNFAIIRRLNLLRTAFGHELATSQQAFNELQIGIRLGKLPDLDWSWLAIWTIEEAEKSHYHHFLSRLNAGEAACLAMALVRDCRILTDDRDARKIARRLKIPLSGTLGVLVRLVDIGALRLVDADNLLLEMIDAGYRSPITSLQELD